MTHELFLKKILPFIQTWILPFLDITGVTILITLIILGLYRFYRKGRTFKLFKGIILIILLFLLSKFLKLNILYNILSIFLNYGIIALIIVFQPEVRRFLVGLGENKLLHFLPEKEKILIQNELIEAITYLAKRRIGSLIVLERSDYLGSYVDTGIKLNSNLSSRLLITLFNKRSLLHDGAVIINYDKIEAAGCILPLSDNPNLDTGYGTRHRAALGLSEVSDAITIVISEQTGRISFCEHGEIETVAVTKIRQKIEEIYQEDKQEKDKKDSVNESVDLNK